MSVTHSDSGVLYSEKLHPSATVWALVVFGAASTSLMVFPVSHTAAFILPIVVFVLLLWWMKSLTLPILVTDQQFIVGQAHIERGFISAAIGYDAEEARTARGVDLDARAFLVLRPWVKTAVRITIDDATDPTPYWLVASRRPHELAAALNADRRG